jgi:hypothetical protein
MRDSSTGAERTRSTWRVSLAIIMGGFVAGVATNNSALHLRDDGLEFGLVALLLLAPLGLLVGEIVAICSRAWLGAVLLPIAIAVGLVFFGPV